MQRHAHLRKDPQLLQPHACRVLSVRFPYLPDSTPIQWRQHEAARLRQADQAVVSLYARGRDYHKLMRSRLGELGRRLGEAVAEPAYRPYCDSAPIMEVELAQQAGLGWRGKHTLLLNREGGSMFFLGELLVNLPLPIDAPVTGHCGTCEACLHACPTGAIVAPYQLDARRCISYLTIEHEGPIPLWARPLMGNRIYGCDDCQLVCPWNRFAQTTSVPDFQVRNGLDHAGLLTLFAWTPEQFQERMAGSAIYRIGYERWQRNLAVALGNAAPTDEVKRVLQSRLSQSSELVGEHIRWALQNLDVSLL